MLRVHDIAILGATPAALAAAYVLAKEGHDVVVVDSPGQSIESPLADWVCEDFARLPGLPRSLLKDSDACAFNSVVYHSAALDRISEHPGRKTLGYFVQSARLVKALTDSAAKTGAKFKPSTTSPAIRLEEDMVELLGSTPVRARFLIVAQNSPQDVISELALPVPNVPQSPIQAAGLDIPIKSHAEIKAVANALHVVQSAHRGQLGMFLVTNESLHLRIISPSENAGTQAAELSAMLGNLQKAGILPAGLAVGKARGAMWRPPAGVALELDTHVAKRCLLTGASGGFADCITGGTLWPSVRSALLAAEVVGAAMKSPNPQNILMQYKTSWRKTLAEFLRPPNTSLSMLMPLLFVNSRIVAKFTHALLRGESI